MLIQTIGVVGANTMGHSIAQTCAAAGIQVVMVDIQETVVQKGLATIASSLDRLVKKEKLADADKATIFSRVRGSTRYEDLHSTDLVIDATTENLGLKIKILQQLDGMLPASTLIESNTSSISIT